MGPEQEDYIETVLTCEGDFYDPAFHKQLNLFSERLQDLLVTGKKDLILKKVEPWNSVRVTFNIPKEAAQRLKQLAERGDHTLRQLGVLAVQIEGDKVISLTIAGKNNETTELVFRTAGAVDSQHRGASTPASVFDMSSSDEMNLPGPSNVEATRKNIAEYLSQQGNLGTGIFDAIMNQPGPGGTVFKSPNVMTTQCEPIPFRPSMQGQFGLPVSSSPSRSPGNHPLVLPPGHSPHSYLSPTPTTSQLVPQHQEFGAASTVVSAGIGGHSQRSPKLTSLSPGPHFPNSSSAITTMPVAGTVSQGKAQPPMNYPMQFSHPAPMLNNMQRMVGNKDVTTTSPLLVNLLQTQSEAAGHFNNIFINRMPPPMDVTPQPPKRRRKPRKPKDKGLSQQAGVSAGMPNPGTSAEAETLGHAIVPNTALLEEQRVPAIPAVPLPPSVSVSLNSPGAAIGPALQGRSPIMMPESQISMDHIINPYTGQMEPIDKALESPGKQSEARSASHLPAHSSEDYARSGKETLLSPTGRTGFLGSPRRDSVSTSGKRPRTPRKRNVQNASTSARVPQLHNDTSEIIPHSTPGGSQITPNSPRAVTMATATATAGTMAAVSMATTQDILNSLTSAKLVEMGLGNSAVLISNPLLQQMENSDVNANPLFQTTNPLLTQGLNPLLQGGAIGHLFQQGNLNPMLHNDLFMAAAMQNRSNINSSVTTSKNESDSSVSVSSYPVNNNNPHLLAGTVTSSNMPDMVLSNPVLHRITVNPFQMQSGSNPPRQGEMSGFPVISQMNIQSSQQERSLVSEAAGVKSDDVNLLSSGNKNAVKGAESVCNNDVTKPVSIAAQASLVRTGESSLSERVGPSGAGTDIIRHEHVYLGHNSTTASVITSRPNSGIIQVSANAHQAALLKDSNNTNRNTNRTNALHTHINRASPALTNSIHEHFNHDSDHSSTQSYEGLTSVAANVSDVKENHKDALTPPQDSSDNSRGESSSSGDQIVRTTLERNIITVGMALEEKVHTDAIMAGINDKLLNLKNAKLDANHMQKAALQHTQYELHGKMGIAFSDSSREKTNIEMPPIQLKSVPLMVRHCDKLDRTAAPLDTNKPQTSGSKEISEHSDLISSLRTDQVFQHSGPVNGDAFPPRQQDHLMSRSNENVPLNCHMMRGNLPLSNSVTSTCISSNTDIPVHAGSSLMSSRPSRGMDFYSNTSSDLINSASLRESSLQTSCGVNLMSTSSASSSSVVTSSGSIEKHSLMNVDDRVTMVTSHTAESTNSNPAPTTVVSDSNCQREYVDSHSTSLAAAVTPASVEPHRIHNCLPHKMDYFSTSTDRPLVTNFIGGVSVPSSTVMTSSREHVYSSHALPTFSVADSYTSSGTVPRMIHVGNYNTNALLNSIEGSDKWNAHVDKPDSESFINSSVAETSCSGMSTSTCGLTVPGQGEPLTTLATLTTTTSVVQSRLSSLSSTSLTDLPSALALDNVTTSKNMKRQLSERDVHNTMMDVEMAEMLERKVAQSPKKSSKNYTVSKLLDESKKERARVAGLLAAGDSNPRGAFSKTNKAANALDVNLTPRNANLHLNFLGKSLSTPPLLNSTPHPITAPCFPLNLTESVQKIMKAIPSGDGLLPQLSSVKPLTSKSSPRSSPCAKTNLSLSPPQSKRKMLQVAGTAMTTADTEVTIMSVPNISTCPAGLQLHQVTGAVSTFGPPSAITPPADHVSPQNPEPVVSAAVDVNEKHLTPVHPTSSHTPDGEVVMASSSVMVASSVMAGSTHDTSFSARPASVNTQEPLLEKLSFSSLPGNHTYAASPSQDPLQSASDHVQQTAASNSHVEPLTQFHSESPPPPPPHTPTPPPTPLSPPLPPSELSCEPSTPAENSDEQTHRVHTPVYTLAQHSTRADTCQSVDEQGESVGVSTDKAEESVEPADAQSAETTVSSTSSSSQHVQQSHSQSSEPTQLQASPLLQNPAHTQKPSSSPVTLSSTHTQQPPSSQVSHSSPHTQHLLDESESAQDAPLQVDDHQTSTSVANEDQDVVNGPVFDCATAASGNDCPSVAAAAQTSCASSVPCPDSATASTCDTQLSSHGTSVPPGATEQPTQGTTVPSATMDQDSQGTVVPSTVTEEAGQDLGSSVITPEEKNLTNSLPVVENQPIQQVIHPQVESQSQQGGAQVTTPTSSATPTSSGQEQEKAALMPTSGGAPLSPAVIDAECAPSQPSTPEFSSNVAKLVREKSTEESTPVSARIDRCSNRGSTESLTSVGSKDENMPKIDEVGCNGPRTRRKTLSESSEHAESPVSKFQRTNSLTPVSMCGTSSVRERSGSDDCLTRGGAYEKAPVEDETAEAVEKSKQAIKPTRGSKRKLVVLDNETHKATNADPEVGSKFPKLDGSTTSEAESQMAVTPFSKPIEMTEEEEDDPKMKGKTPPKIVAGNLKVATTKTAQTPEDSTDVGRRAVSTRPKKLSDFEGMESREGNAETGGGGRRGRAKQEVRHVAEEGIDAAKNGGQKVNAEMGKTDTNPQVDEVKRGQGRRIVDRTGRRSPTVAEDKSPGRLNRARGKMSPSREMKTQPVEKEGVDSVYKRATRSSKPKDHFELPPPVNKRRRASRDQR